MPCDNGNLEFYRSLYNTLGPKTVLKFTIFNDQFAECSTVWRTGLSINDIAAFHCVDKEWNGICKEYVGKQRQQIVEKCKNYYTIRPSTLIFNAHQAWCCLAKQNEDDVDMLLTGTVNEKFPHEMRCIRFTANLHIRSLDTTYYGPNDIKPINDMFLILCPGDSDYLLLPSQQRLYYLETPHGSRNIWKLRKTTASLLTLFNQSESDTFWYPVKRVTSLITLQNSRLSSKLTLSVFDPLFGQVKSNLILMHEASDTLTKPPCACDAGIIATQCQTHYQQLCKCAEEESLAGQHTKLTNLFIRYHMLHKIRDSNNSSAYGNIQFHANAVADLIVQTGGRKILLHSSEEELGDTSSYNQLLQKVAENHARDHKLLHKAAEDHASGWHRNGLVLYSIPYNEESIRLPQRFCKEDGTTLITLKNRSISKSSEETVLDVCHLFMHGSVSYIFSLHNNRNSTKRVLFFDPAIHPGFPPKFYSCQYGETLKNGFDIIRERDDVHTCSITAPDATIAEFMTHIRNFKDKEYIPSPPQSFTTPDEPFKENPTSINDSHKIIPLTCQIPKDKKFYNKLWERCKLSLGKGMTLGLLVFYFHTKKFHFLALWRPH